MRRSSTIFLQLVIVLLGVGVLIFLLWEPHIEGRNAQSTVYQVYFNDPLLAYVYLASIPFFIALYQAFNLLSYVDRETPFTQPAVATLRTIKYCAISIIGFIAVSLAFIPFTDGDDRPQGVVMRILVASGSILVATTAAILERVFQKATMIKSENDLTV